MTPVEHLGRAVMWIAALFAVIFLMTPLVVTVAVSFGSSSVFSLPPPDWSMRWYDSLAGTRGLWPALLTSIEVAAFSTVVAVVLGTLCAIALVRGRFPGRDAIATFLVSPLMLPGLVVGIAMLQGFKAAGLREAYSSLLIAHVIITLPYVVRTVLGALSLFDFSLIDAARTLGCSYPRAIVRVLVPGLGPAFLTSGMFAFLASMDNYPISIFFTDAWTKTLPIQMLQYVEENPDPTIAAISAGLVLLAILVLIIGDRLVTGDLILTLDAADRVLHGGAIAVADRTIVDIGTADELGRRWTAAKTIDGKGRIVMPGLVNVHNHTPLMITRGMIEDIGFAPMYTPGIPQGHWLTEEDAYVLSSLGMYELLRAGCTTVVDFYRYPSAC